MTFNWYLQIAGLAQCVFKHRIQSGTFGQVTIPAYIWCPASFNNMLWHVVAFFRPNFGRAQLCDPDAGLNLSLEVCGASDASTFWFENSWNHRTKKTILVQVVPVQKKIKRLVAMPRPSKLRRRTPVDGMGDEDVAVFEQFKEDAWAKMFYVCAIL